MAGNWAGDTSLSRVNTVGLRNVGSYQVSGHPFLTGSTIATAKVQQISFPYVVKQFTVVNTSTTGEIRVHFQSGSGVTIAASVNGGGEGAFAAGADVIANKHYVTVPKGSAAVTMDVKCSKLYVSNLSGQTLTYEVFAELTNIPTGSMYHLTGSGITE